MSPNILILGWNEEDWLVAVEWLASMKKIPDEDIVEFAFKVKGYWYTYFGGSLLPFHAKSVRLVRNYENKRKAEEFLMRLKHELSSIQ